MSRLLVAAFLLTLAAGAAGSAAGAGDPGKTAICREYGPLQIEVGVWTRKKRKEFFAAAWSPGATRTGGLAVFGRATPSTINTDANCRRLPDRGAASAAMLDRPVRYRRTSSGISYFVSASGRRRAGSPLHQRGVAWYGVAERPSDLGQDVIARRLGHGLRFRCGQVGKVVVHVRRLVDARGRPTGSYFSVRAAEHPRLLAVARLSRSGESWFRISRRCERDRL